MEVFRHLSEGGPVYRLMHRISHRDIRPHRHEYVEIVVVHAGGCAHILDGVRYRVRAGDVLIVREGSAHGYAAARGLVLSNVMVRAELVARWAEECGGRRADFLALFVVEPSRRGREGAVPLLRFGPEEMAQLEEVLTQLARAQEAGDAAGRLDAQGLLRRFVAILLRRLERATGAAARATHALAGALESVERELAGPVRVAELARAAGVSERTLTRWFRRTLGRSPLDYVLRLKLARAAERLMAEPEVAVTEIAFACGFNDSNYFTRQFRRVHGRTPTEYRGGRRKGAASGGGAGG